MMSSEDELDKFRQLEEPFRGEALYDPSTTCVEEPTGTQATHSWELFEYSLFIMLSLHQEFLSRLGNATYHCIAP